MSILAISDPCPGYAGKLRVFAMGLDYTVFIIAVLFLGKVVPGSGLKAASVALLYVLYFVVAEWKLSRTLGKAVFGLEVQTLSGEPCTLAGSVARNLLRLVEANPVLLGEIPGGIAIMMSPLKQRIGDRLGGVVVRRKTPAEVKIS
jgi:uncharacterized RDD family membrane protein YckC